MESNHPEQLGRYDLIRVRGSGAMGLVYEAFDPVLNRPVAVKTIRLDHLSDNVRAEFMTRFRIEAHAAGRLHSPNIVAIHDAGCEASVAYLVMELVEGNDLREILAASGPLGLDRALPILRDLLRALEIAHGHGIVHRDVKPANILVDMAGSAKLGDFGAARILDSGDATLTGGSVIGTLKYMSPEQLRGETVDARVDVYAAGVVLYEMLTWKKPFDGSNDYQVCQSIMNSEPVPASSLVPTVPEAIDRFIQKAISRERTKRFATAAEFSRELADAFPEFTQSSEPRLFDAASGPLARRGAWTDAGSSGRSRALNPSTWDARGDGRSGDSSSLGGVLRESELIYWKDVRDSSDPADVEGFLAIFPRGIYAELARRRLRRLTGEAGAATGSGVAAVPPLQCGGEASRTDETLWDRRKVDAPRGLETERRERERQAALRALDASEERRQLEAARLAARAGEDAERQAALDVEAQRLAEEAALAQRAREEAEREAALLAEEAEQRRLIEHAERAEQARRAELAEAREADARRLAEEARLAQMAAQETAREAVRRSEHDAEERRRADEAERNRRDDLLAPIALAEAREPRAAESAGQGALPHAADPSDDAESRWDRQWAASAATRSAGVDDALTGRRWIVALAVLGAVVAAGAAWQVLRPGDRVVSAPPRPSARLEASRRPVVAPSQAQAAASRTGGDASSERSAGVRSARAGSDDKRAPAVEPTISSASVKREPLARAAGLSGERTTESSARFGQAAASDGRGVRPDTPRGAVDRVPLRAAESEAAVQARPAAQESSLRTDAVRSAAMPADAPRAETPKVASQPVESARVERSQAEAVRADPPRAEAVGADREPTDVARAQRERASAAPASAAVTPPKPARGALIPTL